MSGGSDRCRVADKGPTSWAKRGALRARIERCVVDRRELRSSYERSWLSEDVEEDRRSEAEVADEDVIRTRELCFEDRQCSSCEVCAGRRSRHRN